MTDTAITVHRSIARVLKIDGVKHRVIAEDFRTVKECEQAMDMVVEFALRGYSFADWDDISNEVMYELGIQKGIAFGCSILAEPLP